MVKVTIKDVAREAGVSISTVSNALNDVDVLSESTKTRVLDAVKRLNYTPNLNGKNLKAKKNQTIGVYMPSLEGFYYGTLTDAMSKQCEELKYELIVHVTQDMKLVRKSILGHSEDGVILLYGDSSNMLTELLTEYNIPAVFLGKEVSDRRISSMTYDSYNAGRKAAELLVDAGNRKIGYIHGILGVYDDNERFRGFMDVLNERGIEFDKKHELFGGFNVYKTYDAVKEYMTNNDDYADAFFSANDNSAVGCMSAIFDAGLRVPENIAVVGCDGLLISKLMRPVLTTIKNPIEEQGKDAVNVLIELIDGTSRGKSIKLPVSVIKGETVIKRN